MALPPGPGEAAARTFTGPGTAGPDMRSGHMRFIGLLLAVIGAAVFTLPHWLPLVARATVTAETFVRAGQVGGALIGAGVVLFLFGLFRGRR